MSPERQVSRVAGVKPVRFARWLRSLRLGLAQRTMLLLVAAVSGSLAVLAAGFVMQRQSDLADFGDARARAIAAQVHSTRLILQSVPAANRPGVSEALRASGTVLAFPARDVELPPAATPESPRRRWLFGGSSGDQPDIANAIQRYTMPPAAVRYALQPGPSYWVSQLVDGERWWIVVLAGRPPPAPGGEPWLLVAAVLLALLVVAALYAATVTSPLRKLAAATHRIGDSWPEPVSVDGPAEVRDLADSFNAMLVRLRQIEDERRVLIGGLPHDLRAPLTRLRLRIAALAGHEEDAGIDHDIAAIDHIVRQFTEYLRGTQSDEPRLPLDQVVHAAVDAYRSVGRDVRADGTAGAAITLPQFATRRLLDNLIENAVQHGREPVSVHVQRSAGGAVELTVTDHGGGISAEAAEIAMQPFTKLDPARGRGGCGLGLAIVRQIARQLGGGVRFERQPNSFGVVVSFGVK